MANLKEIIDSILEPKKGVRGNTLVVHNHLSQMKLFGVRRGIELLPEQDDDFGSRKKFIDNIWTQNKLGLYLGKLWDYLLCKGEVLLYLRPAKNGEYKVHFYYKGQFKDRYDKDGELDEVTIIYSYKVKPNQLSGTPNTLRWIRIVIDKSNIQVTESDGKPSFDAQMSNIVDTKTYTNSLGFIPCIVAKNKPQTGGVEGEGDFDWLASQIEEHDLMVESINENLALFGGPTLVSTRSANQLMEAIGGTDNLNRKRTLTSAGGWYGSSTDSQAIVEPSSPRKEQYRRIKKIVGNVQPEERFGYISPDPITPDHARHARESRESLHYALGGIDELGINSNSTAYEIKAIYGKVSATAADKAEVIYTYGICLLFELALAAEEELFRRSTAVALKKDIAEVTDDFLLKLLSENKIPNNVFGLPPLGKRKINWRWTGPVFEQSPRDLQLKSIVARNFQELGVRSLEALRVVFDDKTDKELEAMLEGGYPFRYMSSVASTTSQLLQLYQGMLSLPNQENLGGQLLGSLGNSIPVEPLINRSIQTLYKELNYDPDFEPVQPGDIPNYATSGYDAAATAANPELQPGQPSPDATTNATGLPTPGGTIPTGIYPKPYTYKPPFYPSPLQAAGIQPYPNTTGTGVEGNQQPVAAGVYQPNQLPEYTASIPAPGSVVNSPGVPQPQPGLLQQPGFPGGTPIPPDLAVGASQPGSIWQQLFPNFSKLLNRPKSSSRKNKK